MNNIKYILLSAFFCLSIISGCKKDDTDTGNEGEFYPRIFDRSGAFQLANRIIAEGQSAVFSGLQFSPSDRAEVVWKVNDKVVSSDTAFVFKPTSGGEYKVTVEASFNGQMTSRTSNILVNPNTYSFKPFTNVALAYLSVDGLAKDVDWTKVTHVAFKCAWVNSDGLDVSAGQKNQAADELVARAHINKTPVILGISGNLSGIDGWSRYESNDFGAVIIDPAKRAVLVKQVVNYVTARKMDGVDVMMTDMSIGADKNIAAVDPLIKELKAALPANSIVTATVTTNWLRWGYGKLAAADWVNVHAFEDGAVSPGAARAQPSSYDYMLSCAANWVSIIPKDRIVLGIPAFGLRYTAIDANGNNLSWGSYDYVKYFDILKHDPQAFSKETTDMSFGVFYNGIPLVEKKAKYIKSAGFKGAYLWAADYDVLGEQSLMATIAKDLK
ncbi:glycosyl hydrolase family 18 protein [Pedobacter gandavensis]|uniref:glycosyl hydrolase family 18 protein n=1 Tax=Pedobacter gandavensis TaxID=2679963 RepID=UPI00292DE2FC|nr:glycosyl hydrolase family 18 protein [Pedobacter gandavensis]